MSDPRDVQTEEQTSNEQIEQPEAATENVEATEQQDPNEAKIAELEAALAASQATVKEQQEGVLRARADMENARRRADTEVEKARKFALERFAGDLLPVIDNLERAVELADSDNDAIKPMIEGVEMTLKSFASTIEKFGVTPINPEGESFNPEMHQAMSMQESADFAPNTVMAVMQKGYELNGRLLRPAMVMVSRAPSGGVDTEA